jgi:hypothetical protein
MKITLVITFVRPVLINETVQQQYTSSSSKTNKSNRKWAKHHSSSVYNGTANTCAHTQFNKRNEG